MKRITASLCVAIMLIFALISATEITTYSIPNEGMVSSMPLLLVSAKASGTKALKLSWDKIPGAVKYVVCGNLAGEQPKILQTVSKGTSITIKSINGESLKAHECYSFFVSAYDENDNLISVSDFIYPITGNTSDRNTNVKTIKPVYPEIFVVDGGAGFGVLAKRTTYGKNKRLSEDTAGVSTRYYSDNPAVATVSEKGEVHGHAAGVATIYIQDVSGQHCSVKVTVVNNPNPTPMLSNIQKMTEKRMNRAGNRFRRRNPNPQQRPHWPPRQHLQWHLRQHLQ